MPDAGVAGERFPVRGFVSTDSASYPYWRLSSFYFLYFSFLGAMVPYWALYLEAAGLGAAAIGAVLAMMAATRIVAPNFWGWLADRSERRLLIIRAGAIGAFLSLASLVWRQDLPWVIAMATLHTFFWNAILAQYEVITLTSMRAAVHRYGLVRLWGSVSFVLAVALSGVLFDHLSVRRLPWLLALLLALIAIGSFAIRDAGGSVRHSTSGGLAVLLRQRVVLAFLAAAFLLQFSHAPYYGFFSLLLDQHGYSRAAIGQFWALGVVAEIGVFALAHRLLMRFSLRDILMASLLLAALRWLMIGLGADHVWVLLLAQCLHAATFGSFHSAGVELVRRHFGHGHQGQGQALYSAVSFGAGGALGALCTGLVWEQSPLLAFVLAAAAALLGWWLVYIALHGALVDQPGCGDGERALEHEKIPANA